VGQSVEREKRREEERGRERREEERGERYVRILPFS